MSTKSFTTHNFDNGETSDVEADSPQAAAEHVALLGDDGSFEYTDVGVKDERGEWERFKFRVVRETRLVCTDQCECDDPTAEE